MAQQVTHRLQWLPAQTWPLQTALEPATSKGMHVHVWQDRPRCSCCTGWDVGLDADGARSQSTDTSWVCRVHPVALDSKASTPTASQPCDTGCMERLLTCGRGLEPLGLLLPCKSVLHSGRVAIVLAQWVQQLVMPLLLCCPSAMLLLPDQCQLVLQASLSSHQRS